MPKHELCPPGLPGASGNFAAELLLVSWRATGKRQLHLVMRVPLDDAPALLQPPRDVEHEGNPDVRHGIVQHAGRVAEQDTLLLDEARIDVIEAGRHGGYHLQLGTCKEAHTPRVRDTG